MIAVLVGGALAGFMLGAILRLRSGGLRSLSAHVWALAVLEVAIVAGFLLGLRRLHKYTDKLARERITWLRGAQGEALVAWYLRDLPNTWHVFNNVELWKQGDLDHVLIGPGGLFCISTKANRGLYTVAPGGKYSLNGQETDHIHEAQRLAMELKDRLQGILGDVPWIQPVLVAPFAYIEFDTYQKPAWVLHEENLPNVFEDAPVKLKTAEIERYAKGVEMIAENARNVYVQPNRGEGTRGATHRR